MNIVITGEGIISAIGYDKATVLAALGLGAALGQARISLLNLALYLIGVGFGADKLGRIGLAAFLAAAAAVGFARIIAALVDIRMKV